MTAAAERRYDLDWVRIGAFALLILYHVGMFYVPWGFHVKSPRIVEALEPAMLLTNPWRLTLLFLVSGAATRFMADSRSLGVFTRERMGRLVPPLIFGMLVIVPPQTWAEVVQKLHYAGSPMEFYRAYVTASGGWEVDGHRLITPTWNHLWFVAYLVVYTLLLAGLRAAAGGPLRRLGEALGRAPAWMLMAAPIVWLAAARILLIDRFPETHALVDDPYVHAVSLAAFLFGFVAAKAEGAWARFARLRWPALALAVSCWLAIATYAWTYRAATPPDALIFIMRLVYATDQWSWIVAILGFATHHLRGVDHPARRYLTEAIFPFYIVHQTIIVLAGPVLARQGWPLVLEGAALVGLTTGGCFAAYETVRRIAWLRPLFGLKTARQAGLRQPAAAAA